MKTLLTILVTIGALWLAAVTVLPTSASTQVELAPPGNAEFTAWTEGFDLCMALHDTGGSLDAE
jgi:hypothetical protein